MSPSPPRVTRSPAAIVLVWLLKSYRFAISPLYGQVCRYHPTCSAYALQAVETHGAVRGSWLAGRRVLRCHPWSAGGYDPVPASRHASSDPDRAPSVSEHRGEQCSAS